MVADHQRLQVVGLCAKNAILTLFVSFIVNNDLVTMAFIQRQQFNLRSEICNR